ncbi:venom allergen 5 [Rhipicephalus microplus]|uniref:venom allergen 5 n=1 Tax=Rhipicephalus microplus TaxID=6941 RepID=UPI003F6C70C2
MKLSRGKLAYVRVAQISLAIFVALIAPVAEARVIPAYCGYYEFGRGCRNVNRCPNVDPLRCRQPASTCEPVHSGIDDADKEVILSAHNRYRSRIATGNYSKLPHASNMLEMEWDDNLARIAQADADLCVSQSSSSFSTRNGRFPCIGRSSCLMQADFEDYPEWERCIRSMFDEYRRIPNLRSTTKLTTMHGVESFTQLAWATTWKVGCGYTVYASRSAFDSFDKRYTCAYGPGGNVRGDEMYKVGTACANCPEGTCYGESCEEYNIAPSYNGLCKVIDDGPAFPLDDEDNLLLGCLFNKATSRSCTFLSDPRDGWKTKTFFGMGHAESVLGSGQGAEMTFEQPIQSSNGRLCVKVEYNKGPNVTGATDRGVLDLVATPVDRTDRQTIVNLSGGAINLMRSSITLRYNVGVKISFSFMVPRGSPAQYVNIYKVLIYEKACYE